MRLWDFHCAWFVIAYVFRTAKKAYERARSKTTDFLEQADKIEMLEKEHSWREEEFDFVLQFLRTILMKRKPPPPWARGPSI